MNLDEKKVAILATDGFENSELKRPLEALEEAGAQVDIISLAAGEIKGWENGNWAMYPIKVTHTVENCDPKQYAGLVLPGGVMNPDKLRTDSGVLNFVRSFFSMELPVAAICHAPWVLINAEVVKGRKMTSYHSIRKDLENAGAHWVDQPVVVDKGLITSRHPGDLDDFCNKVIEEIGKVTHPRQVQYI